MAMPAVSRTIQAFYHTLMMVTSMGTIIVHSPLYLIKDLLQGQHRDVTRVNGLLFGMTQTMRIEVDRLENKPSTNLLQQDPCVSPLTRDLRDAINVLKSNLSGDMYPPPPLKC
jgi:hypothetical protein